MKRCDLENTNWLYEIEPLKVPSKPFSLNRTNWPKLSKRVFRSYIVRVSIREKRSWPGPVRSHWRKLRLEAVLFFENQWGPVPKAMKGHTVPPNYILYKSEGWAEWAIS